MSSPATAMSVFWLLYMAGMGMVFPFQSLYFRENAALVGTQVGLVLAMRPLMGMLAQPFWGQVADRTGARGRVLALIAVGTAISYALLPLARGFPAVLAAMAFVALFSTAVMPMASAVSMAALGASAPQHFGRVRVWGTVGFLVLVVGFPPLLDRIQASQGWTAVPGGPSEPGLGLFYLCAALFSLAAAGVAWRLPRSGAMAVRARRGDLRELLRHRPYRRILLLSFLAFLFLQGPILLFPLFVGERGGSLETVSLLWIPMLLLEIPLVFLTGATLRRFGARNLVVIGVLADGIRWVGSALAPDMRVVFGLQLLHGVTVAGLMVGTQLYVEAVVPERMRATGQTLVAMAGFSLGSLLSAIIGGWLLEARGADAPALFGGAAALVLGLASPWLLPEPRSDPEG